MIVIQFPAHQRVNYLDIRSISYFLSLSSSGDSPDVLIWSCLTVTAIRVLLSQMTQSQVGVDHRGWQQQSPLHFLHYQHDHQQRGGQRFLHTVVVVVVVKWMQHFVLVKVRDHTEKVIQWLLLMYGTKQCVCVCVSLFPCWNPTGQHELILLRLKLELGQSS